MYKDTKRSESKVCAVILASLAYSAQVVLLSTAFVISPVATNQAKANPHLWRFGRDLLIGIVSSFAVESVINNEANATSSISTTLPQTQVDFDDETANLCGKGKKYKYIHVHNLEKDIYTYEYHSSYDFQGQTVYCSIKRFKGKSAISEINDRLSKYEILDRKDETNNDVEIIIFDAKDPNGHSSTILLSLSESEVYWSEAAGLDKVGNYSVISSMIAK